MIKKIFQQKNTKKTPGKKTKKATPPNATLQKNDYNKKGKVRMGTTWALNQSVDHPVGLQKKPGVQ